MRSKINIGVILSVLVVLLATLAAPMQLQAGPLPVSYFKFDEAYANGVLKNEISGAPDAVFREGTAVLTDSFSTPTLVDGKFGKAIRFDGVNDYLDLSTGGHPNQNGGIPVGSVTFWIKTTTNQPFTLAGTLNTGSTMGWQLHGNMTALETTSVGGLVLFVRSEDDMTYRAFVSPVTNTWRDGIWHHIAVTWDGEANTGLVYIDGNAHTLATSLGNGNTDNTYADWEYPMVLGARDLRGQVQRHMQADIDDFRVYDVQLTRSEAQGAMAEPLEIESSASPEPGGLGLFGMALLALRKKRT